MLFTCYRIFCPTQKKRLILKAIGLEPSLVSDVRCVPLCSRNFDSHQRCSFKMQKTRNFSKSIKDFFKTTIARSLRRWANVTWSQWDTSDVTCGVRFQSFPRWRKWIHFTQTQRPFSDKKIDNNETTYTFLNHHSNTSILQNYFFSVHPLY